MSKKNPFGTESLADRLKEIKKDLKEEPLAISEEKKVAPKLFISGNLDRKKNKYTDPSPLYLLASTKQKIEAYCRGNNVAILNYLIKEGLKVVMENEGVINVDSAEIESNII